VKTKAPKRRVKTPLLLEVTAEQALQMEVHVYTGSYFKVPVLHGPEVISGWEAGPQTEVAPLASQFEDLVNEPIFKADWPCPIMHGPLGCLVQRASPFARTAWATGETEEMVQLILREKYGLPELVNSSRDD
jgi:hypothetical protein